MKRTLIWLSLIFLINLTSACGYLGDRKAGVYFIDGHVAQ
jgi:prepilin-type processing-associated H-X9-DG protein